MLGIVSVYVCVLAWVENKFLELLSEQCGWYRKLLLQIQEGGKTRGENNRQWHAVLVRRFSQTIRPSAWRQ